MRGLILAVYDVWNWELNIYWLEIQFEQVCIETQSGGMLLCEADIHLPQASHPPPPYSPTVLADDYVDVDLQL